MADVLGLRPEDVPRLRRLLRAYESGVLAPKVNRYARNPLLGDSGRTMVHSSDQMDYLKDQELRLENPDGADLFDATEDLTLWTRVDSTLGTDLTEHKLERFINASLLTDHDATKTQVLGHDTSEWKWINVSVCPPDTLSSQNSALLAMAVGGGGV